MKRLPWVLAAACFTAASAAVADPTSSPSPGLIAVPTTVVYGRIDKPNAVIVVKIPAAAVAAADAHQSLRAALLAGSEPSTARAKP